MAYSMINLNIGTLNSRLSAASGKAEELQPEALGCDISGQSEALEKFISLYESYAGVVNLYRALLTKDLEAVASAILTMKQTDEARRQAILQLQK